MIRRLYNNARSLYYDLMVLATTKRWYGAIVVALILIAMTLYFCLFCRVNNGQGFLDNPRWS